LDLTLPSGWYLFGACIFSLVGFAAFRYGKKTTHLSTMLIGIGLMLYPYAVPETWMLYLVGAALCAALYWFRE
jgi:hypothetical protein